MTIFNGKIHYKLPFSIAMLNYQRVHLHRFKNLRLDALLGCRRCCRCWDLAAALWPWPFLDGPSWSERSLSAVNHGINFSASKSWDAWKPIKKNGIKTIHGVITCTTLDGWKPIKNGIKTIYQLQDFGKPSTGLIFDNPIPPWRCCWSRRCVNLPKPWFMGLV